MALKDHVVWNQQLVKLGVVKAANVDDALVRAKKMFPHCCAPIVQNAAEAEKPQEMRYLTGFGFRSGGSKWLDQFNH